MTGAPSYRALQFSRFGEPGQVLGIAGRSRRPLRAHEVRLTVDAVGLNFLDVLLCRGEYPVRPEFPATPGVEVSGTVVETSAGNEHWLGRRVLGCPALPEGALGEEAILAVDLLTERPASISATMAAALPVTYQTAWFALERARLQAGEVVLVHAGAGGVGTAVIQLARRAGAQVIATAGTPEKLLLCRESGAAVALDYHDVSMAAAVAEATGGRGVDVVVDPVGGDMMDLSLAALAFEGRYVAVGQAGGVRTLDPARLMAANVDMIGLSWGSQYPWKKPARVREVYAELFAAISSGEIRPPVHRRVRLEEAAEALDDLAARRSTGKIVVELAVDGGPSANPAAHPTEEA